MRHAIEQYSDRTNYAVARNSEQLHHEIGPGETGWLHLAQNVWRHLQRGRRHASNEVCPPDSHLKNAQDAFAAQWRRGEAVDVQAGVIFSPGRYTSGYLHRRRLVRPTRTCF